MITIETIKQNLGIDITKSIRKVPNVVIRALYAEYRMEQLSKIDNRNAFETIAGEIKTHRTSLYNMFLKIDTYKRHKHTKILIEAFKTQDKKYIQKYIDTKAEEKLNYQSQWYDNNKKNNAKAPKPAPHEAKEKIEKKLNNKQVADFLKTNNVLKKSIFWDKMITKYTKRDWDNLRDINPKMFDAYLK